MARGKWVKVEKVISTTKLQNDTRSLRNYDYVVEREKYNGDISRHYTGKKIKSAIKKVLMITMKQNSASYFFPLYISFGIVHSRQSTAFRFKFLKQRTRYTWKSLLFAKTTATIQRTNRKRASGESLDGACFDDFAETRTCLIDLKNVHWITS